jgi:hypothetical protein
MVADFYGALANANPSVKDVHLKACGSHEQSKCKYVSQVALFRAGHTKRGLDWAANAALRQPINKV